MHELAIAESIVNTVLKEAEKQAFPKVISVAVRIGALTDIVPDSLQFGFDTIIIDTPIAGATLKIESIPVKGKCRACQKDFEVEEYIFVCPNCFSGDIEVMQGQELEIAYIEIEDGKPEAEATKKPNPERNN
jgi:hydrogenase nickel incorporation protein HypA/HybF